MSVVIAPFNVELEEKNDDQMVNNEWVGGSKWYLVHKVYITGQV